MGLLSVITLTQLLWRLVLLPLLLEDSASLPEASKSEPLSEPVDLDLLLFLFFGSFLRAGVGSLVAGMYPEAFSGNLDQHASDLCHLRPQNLDVYVHLNLGCFLEHILHMISFLGSFGA